MAPPRSSLLLLPAPLLALVVHAGASQLTAVKKLPLDAGQKLLAHHLDFAPQDSCGAELVPALNGTAGCLWPAYGRHVDDGRHGRAHVLRRAAEALALLEKRSSCPANMNSCADQGSPHKCCQEGTYCTDVPDVDVGRVACCPRGTQCGGQVASCPPDAVSCPQSLGGGCCIPGYVCRGFGCVPSPSSTVQAPLPLETMTSTSTTMVEGSPSAVIVTMTVPSTSSPSPTTPVRLSSDTNSATGSPSRLPASSGSSATASGSDSGSQTGCPTGFYGCLATHGGGCCRTDRDCNTLSCPPPPRPTTVMANGATIVVPAEGGPRGADATPTCAGGWFLCGESAGPVAGCCPSGYECGTASCFAAQASQTGSVQKEVPRRSGGGGSDANTRRLLLGGAVGACLWAVAA